MNYEEAATSVMGCLIEKRYRQHKNVMQLGV